MSGIPFSMTAHAYDIHCTAMSLRNDTLDWELRNATQVFAISEYGRNILRAKLPAADHVRVHRVYVGISMDLFQEGAPLPIDSELRFLCIASFDSKKGHDTLLDARALLKSQSVPFHLSLYGEGPLRETLANQITHLDLNQRVRRGNPIPQEEVAKKLVACHVFVMPCRKDSKTGYVNGIPTVFMEAMASARAVAVTDAGDIPDIVDEGKTGFVVRHGDHAALVERLATFLSDYALCERMGRAARVKAEQEFGLDRLVSQPSAAYRPAGWRDA